MIEINDVKISFGEKKVIEKGNLILKPGCLTAITGLSGSGKSSLLDVLAGRKQKHDSNTLENYHRMLEDGTLQMIYLKQDGNFFEDMNCEDNLIFLSKLYGKNISKEQINEALGQVELDIDLKLYPKTLSGGQKQKLLFALALLINANLILLDEITASLDSKGKERLYLLLKKIVQDNKCIIVLATHDKDLSSVCDVVYQIEDKEIKCIKNDAEDDELKLVNRQKPHQIYWSYIKARKKTHQMSHLITGLVESAVVACIVVCLMFFINLKVGMQVVLGRIPENQMMLVHQEPPSFGYYEQATLFDDAVIDEIYRLDDVTVYPFYSWSFYDENIEKLPGHKNPIYKFSISVNNQKKSEIVLDNNMESQSLTFPKIFPYFEEQKFDDKKQWGLETGNDIGIPCYISESWAYTLGINKDTTKNCTLYVTADIPMEFFDKIIQQTSSTEDKLIEYNAISYRCEKAPLVLNVLGVMPNNTVNYAYTDVMCIPFEFFEEKMQDSTFVEDEMLKISNSYMLFGDGLEEAQTILTNKIANVGFFYSREALKGSLEMMQVSYIQTIQKLLWSVIIVAIISLVLFSVLYEKAFNKDRRLMSSIGVKIKTIRKFVFVDILRESVFALLLSFIIYPIALNFAIKAGYIDIILMPDFRTLFIFWSVVGLILSSFLFGVSTHLISYVKGKHPL